MRRCRPLLGTYVEIDCDRSRAIDDAFVQVERIHRLMSAHDPDSDIGRINRFAHLRPVRISADTALVLRSGRDWWVRSGGVFDTVRAGAVALERGRLPRHPDQPAPLAQEMSVLRLSGDEATLAQPACIDLGGIAKGHAVDLAIAALKRAGATSGIVNAGGDLRAFGERAWPVNVVDPASRQGKVQVDVSNSALATSAGLRTEAGLSFAHLTAEVSRWVSVTVRAAAALDADVLTKIVWALGQEAAGILLEADAESFAIRVDGMVEPIAGRAIAA